MSYVGANSPKMDALWFPFQTIGVCTICIYVYPPVNIYISYKVMFRTQGASG